MKAYESGGWPAVPQRATGRLMGGSKLGRDELADLKTKFLNEKTREVWTTQSIADGVTDQSQTNLNERAATRHLADWGLLLPDTTNQAVHFYPNATMAVLWAGGPEGEVYLEVCLPPIVYAG
jgi:hypothetical protein